MTYTVHDSDLENQNNEGVLQTEPLVISNKLIADYFVVHCETTRE